jgi:hypothetical protein
VNINWELVATLAQPMIGFFLGVAGNRYIESRPALVTYFNHVSGIPIDISGNLVSVNTHSVVIRNSSRKPATNVRIHHRILPEHSICPGINHGVETLPDGSKDIVIPMLVPGEQITVSYLYFNPLTIDQVNAGIKSDQGFAQQVPVLLQRQFPVWVKRLRQIFVFLGMLVALYSGWYVISRWMQ